MVIDDARHLRAPLLEPLDEIAADRLEQLIADAIARPKRAPEPGLEL